MKTKLKNKQVKIKIDEEKFADYAFLISQCLSVAPQGGFDAVTMKKRIDALECLKDLEVDQEIDFKAEEAVTVKECVKNMKWNVIHKDILDMCESVEKL
jgi:hypothetical protein